MTPLAKRLPRELRRNIGKYLGIFLLMCGSIALTSGFLLAAHSIGCLIDDMRDAYTIEDGRVTTSFEATDDQLKAAEDAAGDAGGVALYKNFSIDAIIKKAAGDDGTKRTLRTYAHRSKVDIASYCEGKEPKADDEVAIDRVFATNNDLAVGDKVELEGRTYTICGIMTQPDSQALFLNNSDFTVNTITYGVAEVTDAGFAALEDAGGAPAYTYSFTFTDRDLSTADRIDAEQDMVEALTDADARVDDLIDADSNQGIGYARDDVNGDSMMWMTLLDIIIVIMAFGYSPGMSALGGIITLIVIHSIKSRKVDFKMLYEAMVLGGRYSLGIGSLVGCIGIILSLVGLTGVGLKLSWLFTTLANGSPLVAILLVGLISMILGMGLASGPAYIVTAIAVGPALADMGFPLMTAHFIMMWFSIDSEITPPVGLASIVGAGIANADPMKTMFTAFKYAKALYILPILFYYRPALLLQSSLFDIALTFVTVMLGLIAFAAVWENYLMRRTTLLERLLLLGGALLLFIPGHIWDFAGIGLFIIVYCLQRYYCPAGFRQTA